MNHHDIKSRQGVREAYAIDGETYDAWRQEDPIGGLLTQFDIALFHTFLADLPLGLRTLEVGSGTGRFTLPMAAAGFDVTASDINPSLLETLQQKLADSQLLDRVKVQQEDIFSLSFPDDAFDFVAGIHVIPRLSPQDQLQALNEVSRVLAPGGHLLINIQNSRSPVYGWFRPKTAISLNRIETQLQSQGVSIVSLASKKLLSRSALQLLPGALRPTLLRAESSTSFRLTRVGWDIFVLARKDCT